MLCPMVFVIVQLRVVKDLLDSSAVDTLDKIESKSSEEECGDPISLNAGESGDNWTDIVSDDRCIFFSPWKYMLAFFSLFFW